MKFLLIFLLFCITSHATEPHFDLPKKDAKEQCRTMNSVYSNFIQKSQDTDNVKIFYTDIIDGDGYSIFVLNQYGIISGILLGENENENGKYYGYYYQNNLWITKHKPKNYSFLLDIENCKVKQLIIKSN